MIRYVHPFKLPFFTLTCPPPGGGVKLFDTEVNRKIKKEPALAIDILVTLAITGYTNH